MKANVQNMIVLLQALPDRHEMQALETAHFDNVVLQAPVLCLKWNDKIYIFKQPRDRIRRCTVRIRYAPEDVGGRQAVALYREAQTHCCRRVAEIIRDHELLATGAIHG